MTTIALRQYNALINSLIDQNKMREAISHCTNILRAYPKCIATYQNLGRALLENKQFDEAERVYSKILSVFPDDFTTHAALSEINEDNRELDKAIWHMERAFETQPSNLIIQEELRRLIGRRDGTPPAKIRLTRGALIRMYSKGDLFQQAIAETLSALEADPDRVDLKVLLARMYHDTSANDEAVTTCLDILSTTPYCYEANRTMFEVTSHSNEYKFDPVYQERLTELDPYYQFIDDAKDDVNSISDEKIILELIDITPDDMDSSITSNWADQIGLSWQDSLATLEKSSQEIASQLDEAIAQTDIISANETTPFLEIEPEDALEPMEIEKPVEGSIPDWISKAGWIRATDEEGAQPQPDTAISELDANANALPAEPAKDLPDWLRSLNPNLEDSPEILTPAGAEAPLEAVIPPLSPDILNEILADVDQQNSDAGKLAELESEDITDQVLPVAENVTPEIPPENDSEGIPDLPDWLKDLDTGEIAPVAEVEPVSEITADAVQAVPGEMTDFIDELSSTDLLGLDEKEEQPFEELIKMDQEISSFDQAENVLKEVEPSDFLPENEEVTIPLVEPITVEVPKPTVPGWVSKILASSSTTAAPLISPPKIAAAESTESSQAIEQDIPELIREVPGLESAEGAISAEVNKELETWLSEINPEEDQVVAEQIPAEESPIVEPEATIISFDTLAEPSAIAEKVKAEPDLVNEPVNLEPEMAETADLQDRLSSMLGGEETPEVQVQIEDLQPVAQQPSAMPELKQKMRELLQKGEFSTFLQSLNEEPLSDELSDELIVEVRDELKNKPATFELWQCLGDMESNRSNLTEALSAYQEAEKQLFE